MKLKVSKFSVWNLFFLKLIVIKLVVLVLLTEAMLLKLICAKLFLSKMVMDRNQADKIQTLLLRRKLLNKKLNQNKVVLKLLVILKDIVKAGCADDVDKAVGHKLVVKALLFQAVLLEGLSQASKAKLKLAQGQSG